MNRWYFWVLSPVMLASAWIIGVMTNPPTLVGQVVAFTIAAALVLAVIAMADPSRFSWAVRVVAGVIFLAYVTYVGVEAVQVLRGAPVGWTGPRSASTLRNALVGLLVFGIPAARIAFFPLRPQRRAIITRPEE